VLYQQAERATRLASLVHSRDLGNTAASPGVSFGRSTFEHSFESAVKPSIKKSVFTGLHQLFSNAMLAV